METASATQEETTPAAVLVSNAGIVIANQYIKQLFMRVDLLSGQQFSSEENRLNAVHYLHYLSTGKMLPDGPWLQLNNVLCGIPQEQALTTGFLLPEAHRELMDSLLTAMTAHWQAIGSTTHEGFRGAWFVRSGLLTEYPDKWELNVEHRTYDLLLRKSPFLFSIINFPWMQKPLYVRWDY